MKPPSALRVSVQAFVLVAVFVAIGALVTADWSRPRYALRSPPPPTKVQFDWSRLNGEFSLVYEQLTQCHLRTEDLRLALDVLIRTAPRGWGYEELPVIGARGWAPWPELGEARVPVKVQSWDGKGPKR